ncbi:MULTISPECIES: undecaprenyl-diphosphate phosphatase [Marinobacter]|jgi:undecaprenyl-diphosphatase|uniref:undecaprenyl-diphosphate phosphatase n=1 Tax=Marinobacter TaxID=2742 RepID=UPI000565B6A3|nr:MULTISPECIES: undecaprenyl-diphosphate phosphatase [Marinobacter]AZR40041.1 undecaprenyl-diphosphate phosphatase [Marinobacter salarius]MAB52655.1 undecaprenyl-diphosphate phosphatase [Marinobacter sp.]MBJ7301543.1 undecaprenyl-diphosphate phosphatase [Marinobacter salarius]MCC4284637.1 undecaprenyl-diphosphate phosphatase [Marinobacter salarius]MCZ4284826.1 undecaprenyl-diphosphate phosphatase [Marinobacter salarius]|tara:strand:+ start:5333 stop:6130 length:798 start_codon:yes stop_codon:yes gene_type:complete
MELWHIIVLAVIQGLTEFLPISSSAHLILPSQVFGWPDQGLAFDVAVHVGTLAAVIWYFRAEVGRLTVAWVGDTVRGRVGQDSGLAWAVIAGTIPAGLAGLLLNDFIETSLRSGLVIAVSTIGFGLVLWWSDAVGRRNRDLPALTMKDAVIIGVAQALALIPGTSRSGITITAALFLGFGREAAARFSFLLSIPLILAAGLLKTLELVEQGGATDWAAIALGAALSFVSAVVCIHLFLKFLERLGLMPFVIYRLVLGLLLLVMLW